MSRKFYRTTYAVELLSEEPLDASPGLQGLRNLLYRALEDDLSGRVIAGKVEELTGEQAANALLVQGSEPGFFRLAEDGQDLED